MKKLAVALLLITSLPFNSFAQGTPRFIGTLEVELLDDGRKVKLTKNFEFQDSYRNWPVPKGVIVDGASIPRILWTVIGGPLDGKYRKASVIHDYYCDQKTQRWDNVHKMFYEACLAEGLDEITAKMMFAAVYMAGPRWPMVYHFGPSQQSADKYNIVDYKTPDVTDVYIQEKLEWIKRENPDIQTIIGVAATEIDNEGHVRQKNK